MFNGEIKLLREVIEDNSVMVMVESDMVPQLIDESKFEEKPPSSAKKMTHLQHLEDLLVVGGEKGYHDATSALQKTHEYLQGKSPSGHSIQTKFDGSPAIIWGHKEGKFFIGTKSFFNKTPKVNFTDKDIDTNHGASPRLAEKLKYLLKELKPITPKEGIFQGDLMYTADEISALDNKLSFTPNTLTYNVDKNSHQGQKVLNSKIGIAAHTHYEQEKNGNLRAVFDPIDFTKFKPTKDINFLSTKLRGPFDYKSKDIQAFNDHMSKARVSYQAHRIIEGGDAIKDHEKLLMGYINSAVRSKKEHNVEGYISYLHSQARKRQNDLKQDSTKKLVKTQLDKEVKNILANKAVFKNLFDTHKHITNAKNVLVGALSKNSPYKETILGEPSKPEGFVVTVNGNPIKFVDRQHFSAANFDFNEKVGVDKNPLVLSWGRMQPATVGHQKMVNKGADIARRIGAKHEVVATRTQDTKNNPLTPTQKLSWLKTMFPGKNVSVAAPDKSTLIAQLQHYANQGVKDLTMVVGHDRVKDFQDILSKYNGPGKLFNFNRARVVSAGERDPDSEDASESISASKMRQHAKKGDYKAFKSGVPSHVKDKDTQEVFHNLRAQMGVVQISSMTPSHALSIYAKREANDKIGNQAKQEILRRKRAGTWTGN